MSADKKKASEVKFDFVYAETKHHYRVQWRGLTTHLNVWVMDGKITEWDGIFGPAWGEFDDTELVRDIEQDLHRKGIIQKLNTETKDKT